MSNHKKSIEIAQRLAELSDAKKSMFRQALEEKGIDVWALPIVSTPSNVLESEAGFPLSFAQQRLWFVEQLETDKAMYNLSFGLRIEGDLNVSAVEKSVNKILERHEILRTVFFNNKNGDARQRIKENVEYQVNVNSIDNNVSESLLAAEFSEEARAPFDLTADLMFRLKLIELGERKWVVIFTVHHIAFDFLSIPILLKEFFTFYQYFSGRAELDIDSLTPELPIQYADFACWQRDWSRSPAFSKQKQYWLDSLQDAPLDLPLPTDVSSGNRRYLGGKSSISIPIDISNALREIAKQNSMTLYMPLLAVFTLLLSRLSGQEDICIGTSYANRSRVETQNLLGFFVNLLVMRNTIDENAAFLDFLSKVNSTAKDAYANQDFPFDALVDLINRNREIGSPLFNVLFVLNRSFDTNSVEQLSNLRISAFNQEQNIARYPLTMRIDDSGENTALLCELDYDVDLFSPERAKLILDSYDNLLSQAAKNPDSKLKSYCLLKESQRESLISESGPEDVLVDDSLGRKYSSIHSLFESQVLSNPNALALIYEAEQINYGELNERANRLANFLRNRGMGPESKVGLYLERSVFVIEGLLAILKAGAAYVPLDVQWPAKRIEHIIADADISLLLSESAWKSDMKALSTLSNPESNVSLDLVYLDQIKDQLSTCSSENPEPINVENDAAYVIYTSGSTGKPKGVVVEHRQILNYSQAITRRLGASDQPMRFGHISTVAADLGNTSLFGALCFGGSLQLISTECAFDADAVTEQLAQQPVDVLKIVPGHLHGLLSAEHAVDLLPKKILILGGEACSVDLIEKVRKLAPNLRIINHYGPTETAVGVLTHEVNAEDLKNNLIPIGRPLANCQTYVLDRAQQLCPFGIAGDLYVGGANVTRGYLNDPERTDARFIENSFGEGRLYRTGDRVKRNDAGELIFLGRMDNQVKVRGYRVELGDVESALMQQSSVKEAVVRLNTSDLSDQLIAYVVIAAENQTENDSTESITRGLQLELEKVLPNYMQPQCIHVLNAIPRTANGKVDNKKLDASSDEKYADVTRYEPNNENEAMLAEIWCQVLKRDQVGMEDDFFAIGGDSILSLQVIARAKRKGLKITPRQMFDHPVIARLATHAESINSGANTHTGTNNKKNDESLAKQETAPLQILHAGKDTDIDKSIFCLHHGGGHTREYRALSSYLDSSIPLYGIQSPALSDPLYKEDDIQVVARAYAKIIRDQQAQGPYRLLGWSLGGVLAMAIASVLEEEGQEIEFIVLIDAILSSEKLVGRYGPDRFLENFLAVFGADAANTFYSLAPSSRRKLDDQLATMNEQDALTFACDWIAGQGLIDEAQVDRNYISLRYRSAVLARRQIDSYKPRKVKTNVYLWWAEQSLNKGKAPTSWEIYCDSVESREVHPGGHYEIIRDEALHCSVAKKINTALKVEC